MALIVKSRRLRSPSSESPNSTVGLREPGSYASDRYVVTSITSLAEDPADRPELLADGEDMVGASLLQQPLDLGWSSVGREVEVSRRPPEQQVAHRPPTRYSDRPAPRTRRQGRRSARMCSASRWGPYHASPTATVGRAVGAPRRRLGTRCGPLATGASGPRHSAGWAREDSNLRPPRCQRGALTN